MNLVKTHDELHIMREGGRKLGSILQNLLDFSQPDINLLDIEREAQRLIKESGGTPSFETVDGYKWATCLCINEEVVHGIPKDYLLKDGDILTIDIGLLYQGLHTDTAWTKLVKSRKSQVESDSSEVEAFLNVGQHALWQAIAQAKIGNHIGHISESIQTSIEGAGYGVVRSLVGHGVGTKLHEPPQVPGYVRGAITDTLPLEAGMTIAIEIIYTKGKPAIEYSNTDGWTIATQDKSLTAVFEHSVLITDTNPEVLTLNVIEGP